MARIYAPAVHVLAIVTFAAWLFATGGNWHQSLTVAVAVLIITCPCALGLAVPVAHVVAASNLFRRGILVKDGSALERLAEIDHVAFDKTGTLTGSALGVEGCDIPAGEAAGIAKALALASSHPAAKALAQHLQNAPTASLNGVKETPGFGVEANINGKTFRLGRSSWVGDISSATTPGSGMAFGWQHGEVFSIDFRETLRVGAASTIAELAQQHIASEIISGDREGAVANIAQRLGVAQSTAAMKPADKLAKLTELAKQGHLVLMVGDGLNDAPALAAAHVSMAPASASDIGRTAADFVFMGESLGAVTEAYQLARRAKHIVQQNFALAAVYNALAVPLAMAGYLNPLLAAIAMSTSSLLVVGNSLRLNDVSLFQMPGMTATNPKSAVVLS
jgi:P-type Cu2+ transporter